MLCARLLGRAQFKPGVLKRWLRLYVPMFWFTVGLFYPYKDGFLDGPGLPLVFPAYDVEAFSVMLCPVCCMCAWMKEGCLRCSFHLSPRVLLFHL